MSRTAQLYLDSAGWIALAGFALLTVLLVAAAGGRLSPRWWIGSAVSGGTVVAISLLVVLAIGALDTGTGGLRDAQWLAIGIAGLIGFAAGTDVQLAVALVGRGAHVATVAAGALLGPVLVVGGYLLLLRTMDWVRVAAP
jgi:hypothetical protein